jgi:sarcosine oxidase
MRQRPFRPKEIAGGAGLRMGCLADGMCASGNSDVIVVGLGAMGSATCYQLAARGVSVIGLDQYEPPHPYGSTHGETRITRLAIGEGDDYAPLVRRSHELWREIEQLTGARLLIHTGGVVLGHGGSPFLRRTQDSARRFGIEHENLSNDQVRERFPMFAMDHRTEGYYEPEAGYVRPESAVRAQLELARAHGAQLKFGERVEKWTASAAGVRVQTGSGTYHAGELVLCAGAWIPELYPEGSDVFAIYRQLLFWFPIREGYEQLRDMPVFVWEFAAPRDAITHLVGFYGFPAIDGPAGGVKLATESYEQTTSADRERQPATRQEIEAMYRGYVESRLPWLGAEPLRTVPCLYTTVSESRFVIDRHPDHDAVVIVSPCSGHGFKHSPAIGEAVAQLVIDRATDVDLRPFRLR